ncbi:MAG: ATPase, T2SS/T4P/T4SS family [bacterium]|nr:ATPase, T2SS/T4P/T4SS family [bacterium]
MKRIGEILVAKNYVTQKELEEALKEQYGAHKKIGEIFLQKRVITDEELASALSEQLKIPLIKFEENPVSENLLNLFLQSYMRKNRFLPVGISQRKLLLATDNPVNSDLILEAAFITGMEILIGVVKTSELESMFLSLFGKENITFDITDDFIETSAENDREFEGEVDINSKPIVRLVNAIILDAIKMRASDIHFEPQETSLLVRYRIDGFLHEHIRIPKKTERMVISRVKIMAKMDITQNRKSQDGNIRLYAAKKDISLRVSTLPTMNGEKVVMRILDKSSITVALENLGISGENIGKIRSNSRKPQGIILVTGPTGSGKTTTLYSLLQELDYNHQNISTIEDPIEYTIKGINQTQIDSKNGMTFASALRTLLRQDPNTVLLGEIRDSETASTAFKAAMTGHLILSTLHTNDELSTIVRLKDLGIAPYLIADALLVVIAQRLVRRVCTECAEEYEPEENDLKLLFPHKPVKLLRAKKEGCEACGFTGYKGVLGIFGVLEIDTKIRDFIEKSVSYKDMGDYLKRIDYVNVLEDGLRKVMSGETTLDEIKRVLDFGRFESADTKTPEAESEGGEKEILVVDDAKTIRTLLRALLENEGFLVREAEDGRTAYEMIKRKKYKMVITDVNMPDMGGLELLKSIRETNSMKMIPVILLTSLSDSESEVRGLHYGADDYITKPIDPEKVLLRVKNIFRRMGCADGTRS